MYFRILLLSACVGLTACTSAGKRSNETVALDAPEAAATAPDTLQLARHIAFLASDEMRGRGTGSVQLRQAGDYIAGLFREYGLTPRGTSGYYQSFTAKVTRVKVDDSVRAARNVIGFLDNGAEYTVVIGAHYDHLGDGHQGSSKDPHPEGKIHNGADDNASGVAGLLELARYFSSGTKKEPCNFLFIAFSAEELGLLGSRYFTENPTLPLDSINFMVNMDMIGRYNPKRGVGIGGFGTSPSWPQVFDGVTGDVKFFTDPAGSGGSDHGSFYARELPVLFFHTGGHDDYHMPGDDIEKVDVRSEAAILKIGIQLIERAVKLPKLKFQTPD